MCTERRYLKAGKHQNMIKFPWNNHTGAINLYLKGELEYNSFGWDFLLKGNYVPFPTFYLPTYRWTVQESTAYTLNKSLWRS